MIDFYWLYDLPTWKMGVVMVVMTVMISLLGLRMGYRFIQNKFRLSSDTNEVVNGFFSGAGVFYGLLLGLVAVATWENFVAVDGLVSREATQVASLYRDISSLPEPAKGILQHHLKDYLTYVVDVAWPGHSKGEIPAGGTLILTHFQKVLAGFHPASVEQQTVQAEALRAFNVLVEARRGRMNAVNSGLPAVLWIVVLIGACISIVLTYFFHVSDRRLHYLLTGLVASMLGVMIFLIAAIDHPFRGGEGVTSEVYRNVLGGLKHLDPDQVVP